VPIEPAPAVQSTPPKRALATYVEKLPGGASYSILKADGANGFSDNTAEFRCRRHLFTMGDNAQLHRQPPPARLRVGFVPVGL